MLWTAARSIRYVDALTPQFTQYLDMFRAHMSYWTSTAFCNYLLHQLVPGESVDHASSAASPPLLEALSVLDPTTDSV